MIKIVKYKNIVKRLSGGRTLYVSIPADKAKEHGIEKDDAVSVEIKKLEVELEDA